ncbi:MAG: hypothetical protein N3A65_08625 [candidate division WOR-3 bacterium]|nr:hypothetical protein [candidate division WOR-3 bacterium]
MISKSLTKVIYQYIFTGLILFNILLFLMPSLSDSFLTNLWGTGLNSYLPKAFVLVQIIMLAGAFILIFLKTDVSSKISTPIFKIIWSIVFCAMCIMLQEASLLYGDALLLVKKIEAGLPKLPTETLSILIYRTFYSLLPASIKSGEMVYRIINTAAVIPAIFCYLKLTQRLKESIQPAFLLLISSLGINALFMGHVENYTLVYVTMLTYFIFFTDEKPAPNIIFLFFSLSVCLHLIAILLLPSLIFYFIKNRKAIKIWEAVIFFVMPFMGVILLALINGLAINILLKGVIEIPQNFFKARTFSYFSTVFSLEHILDIFNLFLLNLPVLPLIVLRIIFIYPENDKKDNPNTTFLFFSIPFLLFIILFDTPLGFARDWDLGSICVILPILLIIKKFFRLPALSKNFLLIVSIISIILTIPWFLVNHSSVLSLERFKDVLEARPNLPGTAYGYEALGRFYWDKKDFANAATYYQKATVVSPDNWRFWTCAGLSYLYGNDLPNALKNLRRARSLFEGDPRIFAGLGTVYGLLGMRDSAKVAWERAYSLDSTDINVLINLAYLNYHDGNYLKTVELCQKVIRRQKIYDAYLILFDAFYSSRNLAAAKAIIDEACRQFGPAPDILKRVELIDEKSNK